MKKHTKTNQEKITIYNSIKEITEGLQGGGNYSPQNSGDIMAIHHLSRPIYDSRGYMRKDISYSETTQVRGEENVLTAIKRGALNFNFEFLKITSVSDSNLKYRGLYANKWEWVRCNNLESVKKIIKENKMILGR